MNIKNSVVLGLIILSVSCNCSYANDKQQIKAKDIKGNTIYVTPNYSSFVERNEQLSELQYMIRKVLLMVTDILYTLP